MPLCPQIVNTPVLVTETSDFTVTTVFPVTTADTTLTNSLQAQVTYAQDSADGKNKITYSTSTPSGSGTNVGDIWWQYSSGIVIGQWAWDGSTWASSPIGNAVIANIDAGKITAGIISGIEYNNGSGTFKVTPAGAVTATSGTIGGWTITSSDLYSGTGAFMNASTGNIGGSFITAFDGINSYGDIATIDTAGIYGYDVTANGQIYAQGHTTTTNTANGYIASTTGKISRSTSSSQRYKENIVPLTDVEELHPHKLLDLPVKAFSYKEGYLPKNDDRAGQLMPGFIAEEVDAVYPIAADYIDGAESWNDRIIVPALLSLVQELYKRVEELEAK